MECLDYAMKFTAKTHLYGKLCMRLLIKPYHSLGSTALGYTQHPTSGHVMPVPPRLCLQCQHAMPTCCLAPLSPVMHGIRCPVLVGLEPLMVQPHADGDAHMVFKWLGMLCSEWMQAAIGAHPGTLKLRLEEGACACHSAMLQVSTGLWRALCRRV